MRKCHPNTLRPYSLQSQDYVFTCAAWMIKTLRMNKIASVWWASYEHLSDFFGRTGTYIGRWLENEGEVFYWREMQG